MQDPLRKVKNVIYLSTSFLPKNEDERMEKLLGVVPELSEEPPLEGLPQKVPVPKKPHYVNLELPDLLIR